MAAIADAMRTEYKMIIDAGFLVQLDDARNAVTYDRMVPPASFADYRKWLSQQVEIINSRDRGPARRPHPLSRLLGQLAGAAHQRRAAQGHRRSDPQGEGRGLRDRRRQSAPRARMEGLERRQAGAGAGADPGRHQPRHQCGRASRTGGRAHCSPGAKSSAARTSSPAPIAALRRGRSTAASIPRSCGPSWKRWPKVRGLRARNSWS